MGKQPYAAHAESQASAGECRAPLLAVQERHKALGTIVSHCAALETTQIGSQAEGIQASPSSLGSVSEGANMKVVEGPWMQVDQQRAVEVPAQMARYAQILAGKHWRDVLGEGGLPVQSPVAPALLSAEATPHNAWQARILQTCPPCHQQVTSWTYDTLDETPQNLL